jgi:hypothetical protein
MPQPSSGPDIPPRRFDVCNGDADGLCAVLQWRLHEPAATTLVTGLKREIALLQRVPGALGDEVLVCDVSMQRNRQALLRLLEHGVRVRWFDHHAPGDIPSHPGLEVHIDRDPGVCSSLLVDRALNGAFRRWALVGAYGDNLTAQADALGAESGLDELQRATLRRLGEAINYNAYGDDERDVYIAPALLYPLLARYRDPLELTVHETLVNELDGRRLADLRQAAALRPHWQGPRAGLWMLPGAPWARRVIGCLANELARDDPQRAHAVLLPLPAGGWRVSLRAPLAAPAGADVFCAAFGGSGRAGAAGIDRLAHEQLQRFVQALGAAW